MVTLLIKQWRIWKKVIIRCQETNLALSHEKWRMLFTKGVVLGHNISQARIEVDPINEVFTHTLILKTPKELKNFLGHVGYYRRFIENATKIATPLFKLITKDVDFKWDDHYQSTFEILKLKLSNTLVLRGQN